MSATGERGGTAPCLRWLIANKMFRKTKEKSEYTHTLFCGGLLDVPDEKHDEFLKKLALDMDHGEHWYVNEIATPVSALYLDADFLDARPLPSHNDFADFVGRIEEDDLAAARAELAEQVRANNAHSSNTDLPADLPSMLPPPPTMTAQELAEYEKKREVEEKIRKKEQSGASENSNKQRKKGKKRDVDLIVTETGGTMSDDAVLKFVRAIQRCVFEYFPTIKDRSDKRLTVMVLTSNSKFTRKVEKRWNSAKNILIKTNRVVHRKTGVHLIWPWLCATPTDMLDMRQGLLRAVGEACGDRSATLSNPWSDVIDEKIYLPTPSLRMVNCDKLVKCPQCKGAYAQRYTCSTCQGSEMRAGRVYRPEFSLNGEGVLTTHAKQCLNDTYYMLKLCTMRRPGIEPRHVHEENAALQYDLPIFRVPDDAPRYDGERPNYNAKPVNDTRKKKKQQSAESGLQAYETKGNHEFGSRRLVRQLEPGSALLKSVEDFLRSPAMPKQYRTLSVQSVAEYAIGSNRYYMVRVASTDDSSKYCQNVARAHNSVRVYFKFTRTRGCQQCCFCRCTSPKPGSIPSPVLCKNYSSPGVPLTRALDLSLFPKETAARDRERERERDRPAFIAVDARPDLSYVFTEPSNIRGATSSNALASSIVSDVAGRDASAKAAWNEEDIAGDDTPLTSLKRGMRSENPPSKRARSATKDGTDMKQQKDEGMVFMFDRNDSTCGGVARKTSSAPLSEEDEMRHRDRFVDRQYAGDASLCGMEPPPGKIWIPTHATHAPSSREEARRMLKEARKRQVKQKIARFDTSLHELLTGDFHTPSI